MPRTPKYGSKKPRMSTKRFEPVTNLLIPLISIPFQDIGGKSVQMFPPRRLLPFNFDNLHPTRFLASPHVYQ